MLSAFVRLMRRSLLAVGLSYSQYSLSAWETNLPKGATQVSETVYDLHMIIFYICVVIAVVVFGIMFWSIFHHRKSKGHQPANFHESTTVEIIWTAIPLVILVVMAFPATQALYAMYDSDNSDIDIQVTGYQWKWRYQYLGEDIDFFSNLSTPKSQINNQSKKGEHYLLEVDEPLVIPINKKIRFLMTSNDVIHAWWVPELAVKKDAIPGFINETWTYIDTPGTYRGQCAELCGKDHGFMPIVVKAVTESDYQSWILERKQAQAEAQQKAAKETEQIWDLNTLVSRGETVYQTYCLACHQSEGQGLPPTFPALKNSPIIKGDPAEHIRIVLHGKTGTAMAAYAAQLSNADIAAVVTFERNAWGQATGDIIQPSDVSTLR